MGEKSLSPVRDYTDREIIFREFTTEEEELLYIIDKVRELKDRIGLDRALTEEERLRPYNNIAVLVRKRGGILRVVDAFLRAGIPYATDGKEDISGEKRVKQLLDILELAAIDPEDHEAGDLTLYRVLTSDYFRIQQVDILKFVSFVNEKRRKAAREGVTLLSEFLDYFSGGRRALKFSDEDRLKSAAGAIRDLLCDSRTRPVHAILMDFIKTSGLLKYILKEYADNEILKIRELRGIGSFVNMVKSGDLAKPAESHRGRKRRNNDTAPEAACELDRRPGE